MSRDRQFPFETFLINFYGRCFLSRFQTPIFLKLIFWYYHSFIIKMSIKYQNINYQTNDILSRYFDKLQSCTFSGVLWKRSYVELCAARENFRWRDWFDLHFIPVKILILHLLSIFLERILNDVTEIPRNFMSWCEKDNDDNQKEI